MLCDICQTREAKIFYTEIVNGKKTEQHLCEQCAAQHAAFPISDISNGNIKIGNILSGLLNKYIGDRDEDTGEVLAKREEPVCPECGMSESDFLKYGRFGCPVCYSTFGEIINKNFKATQGGLRHTGKEPAHTRIIDVTEPIHIKSNNTLMGNGDDEASAKKPAKKTAAEDASEKNNEKAELMSGAEEASELILSKKNALKEALKVEDYELAAKLRDEIKELGKKAELQEDSMADRKGGKAVKKATSVKTVKEENASKEIKSTKKTEKNNKSGKTGNSKGKSNEKKEK